MPDPTLDFSLIPYPICANHAARLCAIEREQTSQDGKLDRLLYFIMGTLATSLAALLVLLLGHAK